MVYAAEALVSVPIGLGEKAFFILENMANPFLEFATLFKISI